MPLRRFKDVVEYRQAVTDAGGRLCIACQSAVEAATTSTNAILDSMLDLFCRCWSAYANILLCTFHIRKVSDAPSSCMSDVVLTCIGWTIMLLWLCDWAIWHLSVAACSAILEPPLQTSAAMPRHSAVLRLSAFCMLCQAITTHAADTVHEPGTFS
jgi:hypothetical protein